MEKVSGIEERIEEKKKAEEEFDENYLIYELIRKVLRDNVSPRPYPSGAPAPEKLTKENFLMWVESQTRERVAIAKVCGCLCCMKGATRSIATLLNALGEYNDELSLEVMQRFCDGALVS
jgi:hypothetical protein